MGPTIASLEAALQQALALDPERVFQVFWRAVMGSEYLRGALEDLERQVGIEPSAAEFESWMRGLPEVVRTNGHNLHVDDSVRESLREVSRDPDAILTSVLFEAAGHFFIAGWHVREGRSSSDFDASAVEEALEYSFSECSEWEWLDSWSDYGVEEGGLFWRGVRDIATGEVGDGDPRRSEVAVLAIVFFAAGWNARDQWQARSN